MISIEQPDDLMSISLYRVLSYRQDKEFYQLVKNWNKRIVIHIKPFYPVTVIFEGENIKFERGDSKKANLKVIMELDAMLDLAYGRKGLISVFLRGKMKIKGLYKLGTVLRFKKIFMTSMKLIASDPNLHYYEKRTK
ncbi:MAG TPA: SCP2 sterol-binding domain-containing protein [Candidatus Atribacteria bacterium]|nr:SCP2 sterol-binding domain-containing protein [Candidatus Atribacteria bacterium]